MHQDNFQKQVIGLLNTKMHQIIKYLDDRCLNIENKLQYGLEMFNLTNSRTKQNQNIENQKPSTIPINSQNSNTQSNGLTVIYRYLFKQKLQHTLTQIDNVFINKLKQSLDQIVQLYDCTLSLYREVLSQICYQDKNDQVSFESLFEDNKSKKQCVQRENVLKLLEQQLILLRSSLGLGNHDNGFSKQYFVEHSYNMEVVQQNKVKSKDPNFIKTEQRKLINQIKQIRKNQGKDTLQSISKQTISQLKTLYSSLFYNSSHFCIYNKIIYPTISPHLFPEKQKPSKVQFRLQAQGFVPCQDKQSSVIFLLQQYYKNRNSETPLTDIGEDFLKLTTEEKQVICQIQSEQKKKPLKYFQFGIIDVEKTDFKKYANQTKVTTIQQQKNDFAQNDSSPYNILRNRNQNNLPFLITNVEGKYFMQSISQAKIISLNPQWQYFGIRLIQSEKNDRSRSNRFSQNRVTNVQIYGLIKVQSQQKIQKGKSTKKQQWLEVSQTIIKQDQQRKTDNLKSNYPHKLQENENHSNEIQKKVQFKEQLIFSTTLPPKMRNKVLKPYFFFKEFQCKITIKPN